MAKKQSNSIEDPLMDMNLNRNEMLILKKLLMGEKGKSRKWIK